ncbi:hypothetical protein Tco_1163503 [Tanacetum coccineum]
MSFENVSSDSFIMDLKASDYDNSELLPPRQNVVPTGREDKFRHSKVELHQFDRLKVWELVIKHIWKDDLKAKWLWKNKKDEIRLYIRNKARDCCLRFLLRMRALFSADHAGCPLAYSLKKHFCAGDTVPLVSLIIVHAGWSSYAKARSMWIICNAVPQCNGMRTSQLQIYGFYIQQNTIALPEDGFKYLVRKDWYEMFLTPAELEVLTN